MIRWLVLVLLVSSCSGCMMLEEMIDESPSVGWSQTQAPPTGGCNAAPSRVSALQTAEPELMQVRK